MIWDKLISAGRDAASANQQQVAWECWLASGDLTAGRLVTELTSTGAGCPCSTWRNCRIADRMLQKARKAGVIRFVKGRWELVD